MHLFDGPLEDDFDPVEDGPAPSVPLSAVLQLAKTPRMSLRADELVGLPDPLPRESPSSWLARAALSQFVTSAQLLDYFGWRPSHDFDLWFAEWFAMDSATPSNDFPELSMARRLLSALQSDGWGSYGLLLRHQGKPRYRFCPICFAADDVPYVRQEWRFDTWRVCWDHQCLMEDSCAQCGAVLTLPLNMVSAAKGKGIGLLAECGNCGRWLSHRRSPLMLEAVRHVLSAHQLARLSNGRALMATLWHGGGEVAGLGMPTAVGAVRDFVECTLLAVGDAVPSTAELWSLCGLLGDADSNARVEGPPEVGNAQSGQASPADLGGAARVSLRNHQQGAEHGTHVKA